MPSPLVTVLLLVVGLALTAGGYLFFKEALYLLGFLAGLSVGIVALGNESIPGQWDLAVLVVAPIVGLVLAASLRILLVAVLGAFVGGAAGIAVAGVSLSPITNLANPVVAGGVVLGIVAAFFVETAILMLASAGWGSTLLCLALGIQPFAAGASLQSGVLVPSTPNLVFELVGLATQVGVWYYLRNNLDDETLRAVLMRRAGRQYETLRV